MMQFVTSTNLKQWAGTKDCQNHLPELILRLIFASVKQLERITIPFGDAVHLSGWDGIVSCREMIDIVPEGDSLWEFGSDAEIQRKANREFKKRTENPVGHNQSESTFVFVTPREWSGADSWVMENQGTWKKVVVYTAVELEAWIDRCPSVGMWLADKLNILKSGGYLLPEDYWRQWASNEDLTLPYQIVLAGREQAKQEVLTACSSHHILNIQALTQSEGVAFAIACIATCPDALKLLAKTIVVTDKNTFDDLSSHYESLIIITTLLENISFASRNNHTVICAVTPDNQVPDAVKLPIVERDGFISSLEQCNIDSAQARIIAADSARDVNILKRRLKIDRIKPEWSTSEGLSELMPMIILGRWNETVDGDKKIVEKLSGMQYPDYCRILKKYLLIPDSPISRIGSEWRLKSPYEAMSYASPFLTESDLESIKDISKMLISDDDPDAVDKMNSDELKIWEYRQKYSSVVKQGVYQSLILLSLTASEDHDRKYWVDSIVKDLLKGWQINRYLSNRRYFPLLAEASPDSFLDFLEGTDSTILDIMFVPQKTTMGLSSWNIYYTELLHALEMLAWEDDYFLRVSSLLLHYSKYKNESNYVNKPINSLSEIYRFQLPQTFVSFSHRITVLNSLVDGNQSEIFELCYRILDGIWASTFFPTQYFKWRHFNEITTPKFIHSVQESDMATTVQLMLKCCDFSQDSVCKLLKLSFKKCLNCCRDIILSAIDDKKDCIYGNEAIETMLRDEITHQLSYPDSGWALPESEVKKYQAILAYVEPKDVVSKHKWMFEKMFLRLPHKLIPDYRQEEQLELDARNQAINDIIQNKGKEGIWELAQVVKCPSSLVKSLIQLYGDDLTKDVCQKFSESVVDVEFLETYFRTLFYQIREHEYLSVIDTIRALHNGCLSICIYAPGYTDCLATIAHECGCEVEVCFWQNVRAAHAQSNNIDFVLEKLSEAGRFDEAIELIYNNKQSEYISEITRLNVIKGRIFNDKGQSLQGMDVFYIDEIVKDLDKSDNPDVIKDLIQIEFIAYRIFESRQNISELRLIKEMMRNPDLLMEIIMLLYKADDEQEPNHNTETDKRSELFANCAFHIMWNFSCCPGVDNKGNVDSDFLRAYIERLYILASEKHRMNVIDTVVGNLLGNLPRNESYPQPVLCEIVEQLKSDSVDNSIRQKIRNSRGVTTRFVTEGGEQERELVNLFKTYRDKVKFKSPRMTKILSELIRDYECDANREDIEATLTDLET